MEYAIIGIVLLNLIAIVVIGWVALMKFKESHEMRSATYSVASASNDYVIDILKTVSDTNATLRSISDRVDAEIVSEEADRKELLAVIHDLRETLSPKDVMRDPASPPPRVSSAPASNWIWG